MPNKPNVSGMVADPDFQKLSPADKRTALGKLTGDSSFASLSDADTMQFVSRMSKPTEAQQVANAPKVPYNVPVPSGLQPTERTYMQSGVAGVPIPLDVPKGYAQPMQQTQGQMINAGLAAGSLINAPAATVGSMAGGYATGKGAKYGAQKLGASEKGQQYAEIGGNIVGGVAGGVGANSLVNKIPSLAGAKGAFESLEQSIGDHPVPVTNELSSQINAIQKVSTTTNTSVPSVVKKLIDRLDSMQGGTPLTYSEARSFASEIGNLGASERMATSPNMQRLVQGLGAKLDSAIQNTADAAQQGQVLSGAMRDYKNALAIRGFTKQLQDVAVKRMVEGLLQGAGIGGGYEMFKKLVSK